MDYVAFILKVIMVLIHWKKLFCVDLRSRKKIISICRVLSPFPLTLNFLHNIPNFNYISKVIFFFCLLTWSFGENIFRNMCVCALVHLPFNLIFLYIFYIDFIIIEGYPWLFILLVRKKWMEISQLCTAYFELRPWPFMYK